MYLISVIKLIMGLVWLHTAAFLLFFLKTGVIAYTINPINFSNYEI